MFIEFWRHYSFSVSALGIVSGFILTNVVWIVLEACRYNLATDFHHRSDGWGTKGSEQRWNDIGSSKYYRKFLVAGFVSSCTI